MTVRQPKKSVACIGLVVRHIDTNIHPRPHFLKLAEPQVKALMPRSIVPLVKAHTFVCTDTPKPPFPERFVRVPTGGP